MTRNLKALGLALVAALAFGAIGAQGASAAENHSFQSDSANATTVLTGQNEGAHTFRAGTGGPDINCTEATFSGTQAGNSETEVTVHPKYSSCTAFGAAAPIDTGGCNYELGSDTTTGGHFAGEHAGVKVECESTHDISVTAACKITFKAQELDGIRYTNLDAASGADKSHSSKSSITVKSTVGSIHYETSDSKGIACELINRADGTYTSGIYEGNVSVTGYEDPGDGATQRTGTTTDGFTWHHSNQVNIWVSGTP